MAPFPHVLRVTSTRPEREKIRGDRPLRRWPAARATPPARILCTRPPPALRPPSERQAAVQDVALAVASVPDSTSPRRYRWRSSSGYLSIA